MKNNSDKNNDDDDVVDNLSWSTRAAEKATMQQPTKRRMLPQPKPDQVESD
jgi:hypothetical protein